MNKKLIILIALLLSLSSSRAFAYFTPQGVSIDKTQMIFEGTTTDAYQTTIAITDPTAARTITVPNATGTIQLSGNAITGTTITASSSILSTATTNIGWSVVAGANTACNTTCTNACVFGQNTADETIVDCAATTADVCVCAGAS